MRRKTSEQFIREAVALHGSKFDYSKVFYQSTNKRVLIKCNSCKDEFYQFPLNHLRGAGCANCAGSKKMGKNKFINRSRKVHGDKYSYDLVMYKNNRTHVKISCKKCQSLFNQNPDNHLAGNGCPKCFGKMKSNTSDFINKSKNIHGDLYDYRETVYTKAHDKVIIICKKCNEKFQQSATDHLSGKGCKNCKKSRGEDLIERFLIRKEISYEKQKTFPGCRYKKALQFDFYLPSFELCIEYDGIQHFKSVEFFGGDNGLKETQKRDSIKNEFCKKTGIKLVRVSYDSLDTLECILNKELDNE